MCRRTRAGHAGHVQDTKCGLSRPGTRLTKNTGQRRTPAVSVGQVSPQVTAGFRPLTSHTANEPTRVRFPPPPPIFGAKVLVRAIFFIGGNPNRTRAGHGGGVSDTSLAAPAKPVFRLTEVERHRNQLQGSLADTPDQLIRAKVAGTNPRTPPHPRPLEGRRLANQRPPPRP